MVTRKALHCISREASALRAEVIVAAPAGSREADLARGGAALVEVPGDPVTPVLWKAGIDAAGGDLLALTIAQCVPQPGWLPALCNALAPDSAAAGGPIVLGSRRPSVVAAYHLRYSPFRLPFDRHEARDVPGDNAVYRRTALEAVAEAWRDGFWENEVHVALRARGEPLLLDPRPRTALRTVGGAAAFSRQRFRHGRAYGAWRAATGARRVRALLAPLVPAVMVGRIVQRLTPADRPLFVKALPFLALYLSAWTAGETLGLLHDPR